VELEQAEHQLERPASKNIFLAEVNYWAGKIGVEPTEVRVRKLRDKWGSCSAGGRVSFNNKLLWQAPRFRKRVIIEQLLLLKIPDDSATRESQLVSYLHD
jgi:predicted metal-dependent hydrolase